MVSKIRVLTIGHSYVVALNRAIVREVACDPDFEVTVAAPSFFHGDLRDLEIEPEPTGSPLRLEKLPTYRSRWIHLFRYEASGLQRLLQSGEYDLVHAWEEPYIYAGFQIAKNLKKSDARFCFFTFQNLSKRLPPPFSWFERATLARAQGWIAGGQLVHQAMRERGYPETSGDVLPPAVDTSNFRPMDEPQRDSIRRRLGVEAPVIGFIGRLTADKGLNVLMDAIDKLGGSRPWTLLILGSGPLQKSILSWAQRRGWSDRVRLVLARHDQVPRYLAAMDIIVAPSQTTRHWKEQFGRMLIEAFACGVPVIASDSGEIPFVVADAGVIIPERDVSAWAKAIGDLLDNPVQRAELAIKGLQRCRMYSVATVAQQYRDYYRWLVRQPLS